MPLWLQITLGTTPLIVTLAGVVYMGGQLVGGLSTSVGGLTKELSTLVARVQTHEIEDNDRFKAHDDRLARAIETMNLLVGRQQQRDSDRH